MCASQLLFDHFVVVGILLYFELLDDHVCACVCVCVCVCVRERERERCWIIKKRKRSCSASVLPSVVSYCLDSCWGLDSHRAK